MGKIAVFIIKKNELGGMEEETALRVSRRLLQDGSMDIDVFGPGADSPIKMRKDLSLGGYDTCVVISGIFYITSEGIRALAKLAYERADLSLIAPVSNESAVAVQRVAPPFLYQTLSVLGWAATDIRREFKDLVIDAAAIDDFCFAFRRKLLDTLNEDFSIMKLPQLLRDRGSGMGVARGVYGHRYGNCYESSRDDLVAHLPRDAAEILDVGCARGVLGELVKKRQKCVVTGVDVDREMTEVARSRLDKVINGDIEDLLDKEVLGQYDCIVCGDVLEHLNNPWKVVRGLKNHLRRGGLFVATTPNVMNWAILYDQMHGKWDYVPFSILSGTHIRFFTRRSLADLLEGAGYRIKEVQLQSFDIPPKGMEFIAGLKKENEIDEEEVRAHEILVVAEG